MAEVAGLVLGGFPLLISALEHYQDCFKALGCWRGFRAEWRKCYDRVSAAAFEFELVLEELFPEALGVYTFLLPSNDAGEQEERWREVEEKLKSRLRHDIYRIYAGTIRDMADTIAELKKVLGWEELCTGAETLIKPDTKSLVQKTRDWAMYELLRTKFSFWSQQREKLLDDIDRQISTLDRLLRKSDEAMRRPRATDVGNSVETQKSFLTFWRHARDILELISRAFCCACRSNHCTELLLLDRSAGNSKCELYFRYSPLSTICGPWDCHKVTVQEVVPMQSNAPTAGESSLVGHKLIAPEASSKRKTSILSALRGSRRLHQNPDAVSSSVSFDVATSLASGALNTVMLAQPPIRWTTEEANRICNLCEAVTRHKSSEPCSGTLSSQDISSEYALASPEAQASANFVSLSSLLQGSQGVPRRVDRYAIAYMLASSQLQLHSSAWIGTRWNHDDVSFEVHNGSVACQMPYLRKSFIDSPCQPAATSSDDTFVTLGIMLLELFWGKRLEDSPYRHQYRSPTGQPDLLMDLAAAQRWADDVEDFAGPELCEAIRWCLARWKVRIKDDSWRTEIQQVVVQPFRVAHDILAGKLSLSQTA